MCCLSGNGQSIVTKIVIVWLKENSEIVFLIPLNKKIPTIADRDLNI